MDDNEEVALDEKLDEFAAHFEGKVDVKILLTTCKKPSNKL